MSGPERLINSKDGIFKLLTLIAISTMGIQDKNTKNDTKLKNYPKINH